MSLSRLYPLRALPRQGQLWSWISFDVANQSFTLIINTLLFSIFFQEVVVRDPARDDFLWSATFGGSMLLVVLASPIAGAMADARACKKALPVGTGFLCAAFTCGLAAIAPGQLWLAVLLGFIVAGAVLTLFIDEQRGLAAAQAAERAQRADSSCGS